MFVESVGTIFKLPSGVTGFVLPPLLEGLPQVEPGRQKKGRPKGLSPQRPVGRAESVRLPCLGACKVKSAFAFPYRGVNPGVIKCSYVSNRIDPEPSPTGVEFAELFLFEV